MNILHVVNISFVIPYFLGKQLEWFSGKGYHEYIVCSPSGELDGFSREYGFQYKAVEILRKISFWKDLKAVFSTYAYIRKIRADIVVGHTPKGGLVAILAACLAGVPERIYFRHGLVYETSSGIRRHLLVTVDRLVSALATKVICVSPSVARRSLEDGLNNVSKQQLLANGTCNGIDTEKFCQANISRERLKALRERLHIWEGDFVLGYTGRLVRDKGIVELVRAYRAFSREHGHVKLLLVGMQEVRDALPEDVIGMIDGDENIIRTGYVSFSEIHDYYALMDVYLLISYREGFPTSVLEASSMELPVITTQVTGCVDSVIDGETGIFVSHDERDVLRAMETLYNDGEARRRMGTNGRRFVIENYRQEIVWKEIEKIYENTDNGRSRFRRH